MVSGLQSFFGGWGGWVMPLSTLQVISRRVVESTYSWSRFCTVNCRQTARNYQLSYLRLGRELNPGLRGGRRECYHSATVALVYSTEHWWNICLLLPSTTHHYISNTKLTANKFKVFREPKIKWDHWVLKF